VNVVTFTDGVDFSSGTRSQITPIENKKFLGEEAEAEYATYVDEQIDTRKIGGQPITAYSVGLRGKDVGQSEEDIALFQSNLKQIASDDKDYELTDWDKVTETFTEIADSLETQYSITNFNLVIPLRSSGKVRLTFVTDEAPNAEVDSQRFIEGTITGTETGAGLEFTLSDIIYGEGLSSITGERLGSTEGVGPITGDLNGSEISFAFTNMTGFDPGSDDVENSQGKPLYAQQWLTSTSGGTTSWRVNSEYTIGGASDPHTEKSSALIYLVLDASNSLNTTQIGTIREAAIGFINLLYNRLNQ
jgi:hypothetical protein